MLRRLLPLATLLALSLLAATAHAALRSPQIPVSGTALQTFFTSQGQAINVNTQQLELQVMSLALSTGAEVRVFGPDVGRTFGAYNAPASVPPLYQVFPGSATNGWFSSFSFRTAPDRLVVSLFDASASFQGATTYLTGPPDRSAFGFYNQAAGGDVFYTQDVRNPGGAARILAYAATGASLGWTWFAGETGAGPGGDFADFIVLVNLSGSPTEVQRTDWGALKSRFR